MGSYCGNHFKVKLKEDSKPRFKELLNWLFDCEGDSDDTLSLFPELLGLIGKPVGDYGDEIDNSDISNLVSTLQCASSYFNIYNDRRIDGLAYEAFASPKDSGIYTWLALFNSFKDQFELEDGQVVYRALFEYTSDETVIWWDLPNGTFRIGEGWKYGEWCEDPNHPMNRDWKDTDNPFTEETFFIPPMNMIEICARQGRGFTRIIPDKLLLENK